MRMKLELVRIKIIGYEYIYGFLVKAKILFVDAKTFDL